jgi:hypothetical protein
MIPNTIKIMNVTIVSSIIGLFFHPYPVHDENDQKIKRDDTIIIKFFNKIFSSDILFIIIYVIPITMIDLTNKLNNIILISFIFPNVVEDDDKSFEVFDKIIYDIYIKLILL